MECRGFLAGTWKEQATTGRTTGVNSPKPNLVQGKLTKLVVELSENSNQKTEPLNTNVVISENHSNIDTVNDIVIDTVNDTVIIL